jgi:multiple sugar transport system permease protein
MSRFDTSNWSMEKRESAAAYMFISPWIVGFLLLTLVPMLASLYFAFTDYNILSAPVWVGLKNFEDLFQDPQFWQSLKVTFSFAIMSLPASLILGLSLAITLNQDIPFIKLWRTLYFLPSVLSGVSVTLLWVLLFNPKLGAINAVLDIFGIKGPGWLHDPDWALPSLVIMSLWGIGQTMIIYLAGLQGVPTDLYEAAKVDGAGVWRRFRNITIPMMSPVIFYNLVLGLIATFQYFTQAFIASQSTGSQEVGGPVRSTLFYNLYLYQSGFRFFEMGYASAMAWILFIFVLILTLLIFKSSPMWVHYEGELQGRS